jgi:hypothetical protein
MNMNLRWRKASDINREYALYELLSGESILLDIGYSDEREMEVCFHQAISNALINFNELISLLEEAKRMADEELD